MTGPAMIPMPTTDVTDIGNRPNDGPLRAGGRAPSSDLSIMRPGDLPSTLSPTAKAQAQSLQIMRDLWLGTLRLREQSTHYLPQEVGEDARNYRLRLDRSVFFNVFRHTVEALVGFVFRKDPILSDDVPAPIRDHAENIDLEGTHLDVFARELLQDVLIAGHGAILVDFPSTDGAQTAADEGPDKLRPYWVPIFKDNILSWRTTLDHGHRVLTQIVLKETGTVADGAYGEAPRTLYRVFNRLTPPNGTPVVVFRLLEVTEDKKLITHAQGVIRNQVEIPIAEITSAGRKGLFDSVPPLLDLGFLNIAHYQQWSDYAHSIHLTNVPVYVETGIPQEGDDLGAKQPVVISANTCRQFTSKDAKVYYASHDGAALGSSKSALDDLVQNMAVLGVEMLVTTHRMPQTAEAKRIDKGSFDSALSVTARGLQDAIEQALGFHAKYMGLDAGGSIKINRDFENMTMDSQMLTAFASAVAQAGIPIRIMLRAMQEGGLISADEDLDEVENEVAANVAAADAQKQAEQALQLKQANDAAGGPGAPPAKGGKADGADGGSGSGPVSKAA